MEDWLKCQISPLRFFCHKVIESKGTYRLEATPFLSLTNIFSVSTSQTMISPSKLAVHSRLGGQKSMVSISSLCNWPPFQCSSALMYILWKQGNTVFQDIIVVMEKLNFLQRHFVLIRFAVVLRVFMGQSWIRARNFTLIA
mgnify:CR=1 FL=1